MTPPEAPERDAGNMPPAASLCPAPGQAAPLRMLRKRSEFLAAARAARCGTSSMLVQARPRGDDDPAIGVGYTCSKKVGNAVLRNRAKRRLREVARRVLPDLGQPGCDYVLIGKPDATVRVPFDQLERDLRHALRRLSAGT